ncbi:MAG: DUF3842 family protein [Clostridiales bacterium]|nr:DUF3842 family protein [Clostridiales bacterium]MDD7309280.1 DUF3842 family protein [Eubacteriales bacterium]MDY5346507.1 DUF3842 family protein [Eubacteriales bacterium]
MKVVVIDGQGGRIGKLVVEQLMQTGLFDDGKHTLIAVGTNTVATAAMLKAGAPLGATGENPAAVNCAGADVIIGPVGIIAANSLLGEVTPRMAYAAAASRARKILIPAGRCSISIAGAAEIPLGDCVQAAVAETVRVLSGETAV